MSKGKRGSWEERKSVTYSGVYVELMGMSKAGILFSGTTFAFPHSSFFPPDAKERLACRNTLSV